ncbi:MAG TPA: phage major capsid protein [Thiobacillus sp.]|nr:phage major capsid protein [Thiobacillus sp.]
MTYFMKKADFDRRKTAIKAKIAKGLTTVHTADAHDGSMTVADDSEIKLTAENVSIAKYIRGGCFGIWKGADLEKRVWQKYRNYAKALGETSESRGGLFVPDVIMTTLIPRLQAESVWRRLGCSVQASSGFKKLSYRVQGAAPTVTHDGENDTLTANDTKDYDKGTIDSHRMSVLVYASIELSMDADINIEDEIRTDIVTQIALDEDAQILRGLGGTQALGLLYQPRVNSTDLSGEIDQDDIANAVYQVRAVNGRVTRWVSDPALGWKISKLKDAEGRYLFPQTGQHGNLGDNVLDLGGIPLLQTTTVGVGTYPGSNETYLIGGDWTRYKVLESANLIVEVTREGGDAWTKGQIGIRVLKHFGGGPMLPATFVVIKGISGT